jgi:hypothetical protein
MKDAEVKLIRPPIFVGGALREIRPPAGVACDRALRMAAHTISSYYNN